MGDGNLAESKQLNTDRVAFLWLNGRIPQWLSSKESACNARDMGLIPGWRRSPGEGHGNPLQYSCLQNPMDGGAWQATVHRVTKSWTWLTWLSTVKCVLDSANQSACLCNSESSTNTALLLTDLPWLLFQIQTFSISKAFYNLIHTSNTFCFYST